MAISTNGTVLARLAGALYNTQMSNATYSEVKTLDPSALANTLYARDFASATDLSVATTLVTNLGLTSVTGLANWVAAQLTAAGSASKGAKVVDLLNSFAQMTADTTYGPYATAFNTKVDAALALSQTTDNKGGTFAAAGTVVVANASFSLSPSVETITGGAGDDTFTASAVSTSGAAVTTIQSGDSIVGGDGVDTLNITATATNNNSLSGLTVTGVEKIAITGSDYISSSGGAAAVQTGLAEVDTWTFTTATAASGGDYTVTVNGVAYTANAATGAAADATTAVHDAIAAAFGNAATVSSVSSGAFTVTSKVAGVALPAYTVTAPTGGLSLTGLKADTTNNRLATGASVIREVLTFTPGYPSGTVTYATTNTYKVIINGVSYTTAVVPSADATGASTVVAATLNAVLGAGTAIAGANVVITGPSDGSALPAISITGNSSTAPGSLALTAAPQALGATTGASGAIDASQFVGSTSISVDGAATVVDKLSSTQSVTVSGHASSNTVTLKYPAGVTAATVNASTANGTVVLTDSSTSALTTTLTTATVNGSVYRLAAASTTKNATAGTLTIQENLNNNAETVTTLNLGITSKAVLDFTDLSKIITLDASASTGNLTFTASSDNHTNLKTVKGGSGNDVITVKFATDVNGTGVTPTSASVDGGAGNDTIITSASGFGTGTVTISGGAGNDKIDVTASGLTANVTIDGGAGTDTLKFVPATTHGTLSSSYVGANSYVQQLTTGEIALISGQVSGVEKFEVGAAVAADTMVLDASKVSQFSDIVLDSAALVSKVTQTITTNYALNAASASYIGVGSTAATVAGVTTTQYAGTLTDNASGGTGSGSSSISQALYADSAVLNVGAAVTVQDDGETTTGAASYVTLTGDLKSATVNMTAGANTSKGGTTDLISTVYITPNSTSSPLASTQFGTGTLTALGNLTSVTLNGNGNVVIDNTNTSKLATINAANLGGVKALGANAGDVTGGLTVTLGSGVAETVTLGSGKDVVNVGVSGNVGSYYDKMDTVTGLKLVANADGTLNTTLSDDIAVYGVNTGAGNGFVKAAVGTITATSLSTALVQAAASASDSLVFQLGGDTYVYRDNSAAGTLDSGDVVIKLTGAIDLDLLVAALNS